MFPSFHGAKSFKSRQGTAMNRTRRKVEEYRALLRVKVDRKSNLDHLMIGTMACLVVSMIWGLVSPIQFHRKTGSYHRLRAGCIACWCPCLVYGQNRQRLDHLEENDAPDPHHGGSGVGVDCIMHVALNTCCAFGWVLQVSLDHVVFWVRVNEGCCVAWGKENIEVTPPH